MIDPTETSSDQPMDPAAVKAAEEAERVRIWESPIGTDEELIDFDPNLHKPGLSPEEIEALLGEASK